MIESESGYIQFRYDWQRAPAPAHPVVSELMRWRDALHRRRLIGVSDDGIGFGNISCRIPGRDAFIVSGTNTGGRHAASPELFTEITAYDIEGNVVECRGPVAPSAESLSHAAIYQARPNATAVIHVHHAELWRRCLGRIPTTDERAAAGTVALALAIVRLLQDDSSLGDSALLVLGGHPEGLMGFGTDLAGAAAPLLSRLD